MMLVALGAAGAVLTAEAQTWSSNSYGLYATPLNNVKGNVSIGAAASSSNSGNKLYVSGATKLDGAATVTGAFQAQGTGNKIYNGLNVFTSTELQRTNLFLGTSSLNGGIMLQANAYRYYATLDLRAQAFNFYAGYMQNRKIMEVTDNSVNVLGAMDVTGKITCHNEIEVSSLAANNIKAADINLELNNAADYVFEEDYDLQSLSEVENYVKANKHLPGMPSATDFAHNGMSVAEMSNKLLEKVEELTLHMIQLEKENKALKAKVEQLSK